MNALQSVGVQLPPHGVNTLLLLTVKDETLSRLDDRWSELETSDTDRTMSTKVNR